MIQLIKIIVSFFIKGVYESLFKEERLFINIIAIILLSIIQTNEGVLFSMIIYIININVLKLLRKTLGKLCYYLKEIKKI